MLAIRLHKVEIDFPGSDAEGEPSGVLNGEYFKLCSVSRLWESCIGIKRETVKEETVKTENVKSEPMIGDVKLEIARSLSDTVAKVEESVSSEDQNGVQPMDVEQPPRENAPAEV